MKITPKFPREKLTKLQRDDFEDILAVFSYLTLIEGQYSFTQEYLTDSLLKVKKSTDYTYVVEDLIYDFRTSISILILDGFEYYFPHRSIQEYFTALFINKLPTDKKHKAYTNLSNVLQQSSTDYSFNFWSLCFELDETVFISNFLIPQLKKIYKQLENKKDRALLDAYFELINPSLIKGDFDKKGAEEVRIFRHANFKHSILDFCEVYDYTQLWKLPKTAGFHDELLQLYITRKKQEKESKTPHSVKLAEDEEIIELLLKNNIIELIERYRECISDKINKWDIDVKRKKNNIDNLLNL